MSIYRLKISLAEPFLPLTQLHRVVDVDGAVSLSSLADHIARTLDIDGQAWQFFMSRTKMDSLSKLQATCGDFDHQDEIFEAVQLVEKDYFYLHLNQSWLCRIRVEKVSQTTIDSTFVLLKSVGVLPDNTKHIYATDDTTDVAVDMDMELSLISAVMLIVGDVDDPVHYGDLAQMGVLDELLKRELIEPYQSLSHEAKITAKAESELVRVMTLLGI